MKYYTLLLCMFCIFASINAFKGPRSIGNKRIVLKASLSNEKAIEDSVIIELVSTKTTSSKDSKTNIVAYDAVYKENKEDVFETVIDSPLLNVIGILFNPLTLVLALYFSSVAWSNVVWFQQILKLFGRGKLVENKNSKDKTQSPSVEDLPFQTFECQKCGMELRPARGRAEKIFGRERFRCSKCGAKASAYFDIDDLTDPRAVARLERIAREKEDEENAPDVSDDDEEDEEAEEEEEEEEKPRRRR